MTDAALDRDRFGLDTPDRRARTFAAIVGLGFLLIGIAGFIPGLATEVGNMKFAGHDSPSELLGAFQVSVLHNAVHLAFGIVGLACARRAGAARTFLFTGGAIYFALCIYGLVVDDMSDANFVPLDRADNALHLLFGVVMVGLALLSTPPSQAR